MAEVVGGVSGGRDVLLQEVLRHLGVRPLAPLPPLLLRVGLRADGGRAGAQATARTRRPAVSLLSEIQLLQQIVTSLHHQYSNVRYLHVLILHDWICHP